MCGKRGTQVHHRHPRQMGGSTTKWVNQPANLMLLCNACHRRIESERAWAYGRGLLLAHNQRALDVAVLTRHGWRYLDNDGGMREATPDE